MPRKKSKHKQSYLPSIPNGTPHSAVRWCWIQVADTTTYDGPPFTEITPVSSPNNNDPIVWVYYHPKSNRYGVPDYPDRWPVAYVVS